MKRIAIPVFCCIAFIAIQCTPPQPPTVDTAAVADAVRKADAAWSDAAKTYDGHIQYFADDATVMVPNEPTVSGKENISKMLTEMHAIPGFSVSWKPNAAEAATSGDLAYTMGTYEFVVNDSTGQPMKDIGKYLTIWKKQTDGNWKVTADMFNSDLPAH